MPASAPLARRLLLSLALLPALPARAQGTLSILSAGAVEPVLVLLWVVLRCTTVQMTASMCSRCW